MKYSFQDIEEMRRMTADLYCCEGGFAPSQINPATVEDRLRTYLANGVSVDDMRRDHQKITERFDAFVDRITHQ